MSNLQPPWDRYLELQAQLNNSTTVDGTSWGREAQLNRILASGAISSTDEIERVARSERRLERYRASLRRQHLSNEESRVNGEAVMQARQQLRLINMAITRDEWTLLTDIGEGTGYNEIAAACGVSAGALRVRVRRARLKISVRAA
jgi:DNA-binding NarL/FixJ family response regulator